jgi:hypothetical protein
MATSSRPKTVPKNYPVKPADYPFGMFRPLLETAQRYLFENELKEVLQDCGLPLDVLNPSVNDFSLTVAHVACFVQGLKEFTGDEKAIPYGRDAFRRAAPLFPRGVVGVTSTLRSVSANDKLFLRIRDAMSSYNRQFGANVMVKWHGGAESDLFEDTGQHCYGFSSDQMICQTLTGFLEEAIAELSGVKVALAERDCMARGALACRWHCALA